MEDKKVTQAKSREESSPAAGRAHANALRQEALGMLKKLQGEKQGWTQISKLLMGRRKGQENHPGAESGFYSKYRGRF